MPVGVPRARSGNQLLTTRGRRELRRLADAEHDARDDEPAKGRHDTARRLRDRPHDQADPEQPARPDASTSPPTGNWHSA